MAAHQLPELLEGTAGAMLAPALFAYHGVENLSTSWKRGDALAEAHAKGGMHRGTVAALDLPQRFKNVEANRWKEGVGGDRSTAAQVGARLEVFDRDKAAVLQLHADRGMHAAQSLIERGLITRMGTPRRSSAPSPRTRR